MKHAIKHKKKSCKPCTGRYAFIVCKLKQNANESCNSCATVVQVLQDLFYVLLHVLFFTCDRSLIGGSDTVKPVRCIHDLGIYLDSDVSMRTHGSKTRLPVVSLHCVRSEAYNARWPVVLPISLITDSVKLDYGSATLVGVPGYLPDPLQSVLHSAVRFAQVGYDHVSSLLRTGPSWSRVPEHIKYWLMYILVCRCRNHTAPEYFLSFLFILIQYRSVSVWQTKTMKRI